MEKINKNKSKLPKSIAIIWTISKWY